MEKTVEVPDGVTVTLEDNTLAVSGPMGELKRPFVKNALKFVQKDSNITFSVDSTRRKEISLVGTWAAHLRNMIAGITRGWEARAKLVYSHFPVKLAVEDGRVSIQNFLGERRPRYSTIVGDTQVKLEKDELIITGNNKEDVGQTAGNLEIATKVSARDKRIFQDGIYITQKPQPQEKEGGKT